VRVKEMIDFAVVQTGAARKNEIPADVHAHALDALNLAYQQVWDVFPWDNSKMLNVEATTSDGLVTLPSYVDNIQAARVTNRPISAVGMIRTNNFNPEAFETVGTVCEYIWKRNDPVLTQPTSAINVRVVSTSASDTSAVGSVRIVGTAGGVETVEDIALDGTSNSDGSVSFTEIRKISKPVTTGRITIKDTSDNELGIVQPWETIPEYPTIQLVPPPDTSTTVKFQCLRKFEWLVDDNDPIQPSEMVKPILHFLMASLYERFNELQRATRERELGADALQVMEQNEAQHNDKDFSAAPAYGMFAGVGEYYYNTDNWPYYKTR